MRILVTGAAGMLGSSLVPGLAAHGHDVYATDVRLPGAEPGRINGHRGQTDGVGLKSAASGRADGSASFDEHTGRQDSWDLEHGVAAPMGFLDVRRTGDIAEWFARVQPEFVVHLAAETDVDLCEAEPEHAFSTNASGTKHVALICQERGVPLAYVSTAGVFDGTKEEPYTEDDEPRPINVYGASKLEGERHVQTLLREFYVVRAGWMVGGGDRDHKFVAKILRQVEQGATTLYVVGDKWGTPTYAPDFARCFTRLIETGNYGLYHMGCRGRGTRLDVAKRILEVLGLQDDVELIEVGSDFFRESYPAPRPPSEMMHNRRLELQGLNTMRAWEESLEEYLLTAFADRFGPRATRPAPIQTVQSSLEPR